MVSKKGSAVIMLARAIESIEDNLLVFALIKIDLARNQVITMINERNENDKNQ